ncbi:MAG: HlyD family efflux transporter periplasmic adaptor subunit [Acidobacteriota bacterium]
MNKRKVAIISLLLVLLTIASGIYLKTRSSDKNQLLLSGTVESDEIQVGSKLAGRVKEVLVSEGQEVAAGQSLIRFDIATLMQQYRQQEARVAQAQAQLNKLEHGYRPEEITQAEAAADRELAGLEALRNGSRPQEIAQAKDDLAAAMADYENARVHLERLEEIYTSGYISKQVRDDASARLKQARARVEALKQKQLLLEEGPRREEIKAGEQRLRQAKAYANMLRAGYRAEEIEQARAQLLEAKAALDEMKTMIDEGEVVAPAKSVITVMSIRPGDLLAAGAPVAKLLEYDQTWVRIYVPEPYLGQINIGQRVTVTVDSFPDKPFSGYIEQISSKAEFTPRNVQNRSERNHQVFGMKIRVENAHMLKPGMAADVRIEIKD